jgi:glucokinase
MSSAQRILVGDIGGTNARFAVAVVEPDGTIRLDHVHPLPTRDHASFEDALAAWESLVPGVLPSRAVFALAGPSGADTITMTNVAWTVSARALEERFGFASVRLVNDFAAQARAMPSLSADSFTTLAEGAVLGPGTGLGMALLVPEAGCSWRVIPTEGGHQAFAPMDAREQTVLERLRGEVEHVSFETVVSGPGLARIYWALGQDAGAAAPLLDRYGHAHLRDFTADGLKAAGGLVGTAASDRSDPVAVEAARLMVMMLATFAGDAVLSSGARGGCIIAGGVADKQADLIATDAFVARLRRKGPISAYFDGVPVRLARDTYAALVGAALMDG